MQALNSSSSCSCSCSRIWTSGSSSLRGALAAASRRRAPRLRALCRAAPKRSFDCENEEEEDERVARFPQRIRTDCRASTLRAERERIRLSFSSRTGGREETTPPSRAQAGLQRSGRSAETAAPPARRSEREAKRATQEATRGQGECTNRQKESASSQT